MPTSQGHREECSYRSGTQLRTYDRKDSLEGGKGLRCKTFLLPQLCPYSTTPGGSALEAKSPSDSSQTAVRHHGAPPVNCVAPGSSLSLPEPPFRHTTSWMQGERIPRGAWHIFGARAGWSSILH